MTLNKVSIAEAMNNAKNALANDKTISLATKLAMELLITLMNLLVDKLHLNSSNSSKPPSLDPNRKKTSRKKSNKPKGGQHGHNGTTLMPVDDPDEVVDIVLDKEQLPTNINYRENGYVARQVVDIKISRFITEYRAEILADNDGNQYIAEFPEGITRPIQYGSSVKANATYLSAYQLIPCERLQEKFRNEYGIPISTGSICNFNAEAAAIIAKLFEPIAKQALVRSAVAHADETGANLDGKKIWLHSLSNDKWTWLEANSKRGSTAIDEIGIIPAFNGVLCHDHWKPYFKYDCAHSLCNAHHLRELTFAFEEDGQKWANTMKSFLVALNKEVDATQKNKLSPKKVARRKEEYYKILKTGSKECAEELVEVTGKRKVKQSKSRNLLERLQEHADDVLRFMVEPLVPFTNNQGERDIRMFKVQQKISGCFRSMDGANNFCKIRSYLSSCDKNEVPATEALTLLFNRKMPDFVHAYSNGS
jgi:transposase